MNNRLLEYYTSLTHQHRQKTTFLLAMFIGLTQVITFLSEEFITSLKNEYTNFYLLFFGVSALIYLLIVGIGHHINNLISASTCRVRHETYLIKEFYKNSNKDDLEIDNYLRDYSSLSKISGLAAIIAGCILFGILCYKVHSISQIALDGKTDWVTTSAFTAFLLLCISTIIFYISTASRRLYKFYIAQKILRYVRVGDSEDKIRSYFNNKRKL